MLITPSKIKLESGVNIVFRNSKVVSEQHKAAFNKWFFYNILLRSVFDTHDDVGYMKVKEFYEITPYDTVYSIHSHFNFEELMELKRGKLYKYEIVIELSGY